MGKSNGVIRYYPGCSLESSAREMGESFMELARMLGLEMVPLEDWSCCGSSPAHSTRPQWALLLGARNLILAEEQGAEELMVMCPSCFVRLKQAERQILENQDKAAEVERALGRRYQGKVRLRFFLEVLERIGLEGLRKLVKRPLGGLKVALYYGCLLSRPEWITGFDVAPYERFLEDLVRSVGAEPVAWPYSKQCCGASLAVTKPATSDRLVDRIREYALRAGAQCLVVFCSLCQMNLELRGKDSSQIPVLYITELLAIAAGSPRASQWLSKHLVDPEPLLRSFYAS